MTTHDNKAMLPCPFCGCAVSNRSNRDWHRYDADHADDCVFSVMDSDALWAATDSNRTYMVEIWNRRAALTDRDAEIRKQALEEAATEVLRVGPKEGSLVLVTKGFADAIRALMKSSPAPQAEPVAWTMRPIYVEGFAVTPKSIITARNEGDLSPEEAVEWIEKLIRHNAAPPAKSSGPVAYCKPCNAAGMSNCGSFDECGEPRCVTCHRPLDATQSSEQQADRRDAVLIEALQNVRHWFESERKSISKGNGSQWSMWQCDEQMEAIDAALSQAQGENK
jgi:hypothetical protein